MRRLTPAEVHANKVAELGLDQTALDLTSIEAIAAALRRAANFLCPCAATTLVRAVAEPMRGLVEDMEETRGIVRETLEAMVALGDFLEHRDIESDETSRAAVLLYAAPPSFVSRDSGTAILLGVSTPPLESLADRIEYVNHLRRLSPSLGVELSVELEQLGFSEVPSDQWLQVPRRETPSQHLAHFDRLLDASQPSGDVAGLSILDWDRPVRFYRGRWTSTGSQSGRFVARRSQAYGGDLWCYIELSDGRPERLVDLPLTDSRWRGCDEAWRLQMAIDVDRGSAQLFRIQPGPGNSYVMQFFSPLPMWARRRLDSVGHLVSSPGCLFAYRLAEAELPEEVRFASDVLWLEELKGSPEAS